MPGITVFFPGCWYNIVALLEPMGIRYYCNVASPPYLRGGTLTYIDYDLDIIVKDGRELDYEIVDKNEYEYHKHKYRYSELIQHKVQQGLNELISRIEGRTSPFEPELLQSYYDKWKEERL